MREWLEKKSIQGVLVLIVLLIWGYNTYSIVGVAAEEESVKTPGGGMDINTEDWQVPELKKNTYRSDFPDPFEPKNVSNVINKPEVQSAPPEEAAEPPVLTLTGIVEKMALVQNQDNQLFFVSTGDTVEGARVQSVSTDSVMVTFESQKITLKINK
ncbi:MAG: hypothetical protein WD604_05450 [Balneolaceae bacterium]